MDADLQTHDIVDLLAYIESFCLLQAHYPTLGCQAKSLTSHCLVQTFSNIMILLHLQAVCLRKEAARSSTQIWFAAEAFSPGNMPSLSP